MTRSRAVHPDERGGVLVEAALVLPLVFLLVIGAADLGLWIFGTTQASNAARDGARVGIIRYLQADAPLSADAAAIRTAVERRLDRKPSDDPVVIAVRCVDPLQTGVVAGGCSQANPINRDRVEVTVSWRRRSLSFVTMRFGSLQTVRSRAAMVILGRPAGVSVGA
jgi:hypothetical protein